MIVRVLADDLTGALDACACFAGTRRSLPVCWRADVSGAEDGDLGLDIETRDLDEPTATDRVRAHLPRLASADVAFKKIDSLMRGNSVAEISACAESGAFRSLVLAPAFPAQGRITRDGQQLAWRPDQERWTTVGPNLLGAVSGSLDHRPIHVARGRRPAGRGFFVCDAETDGDLRAIANATDILARPILWCGTAGLAHALAGPAQAVVLPCASRILVVIGSRHPTSVAQVAEVRKRWPGAIVDVAGDVAAETAAGRIASALDHDGLALLTQSEPAASTAEADARLSRLLAALSPRLPIDACIASGGSTLRILLDAAGCSSILVEGEVEPGIPFARLRGGHWNRAGLVSKAGAFGGPSSVVRMIETMRGGAAS